MEVFSLEEKLLDLFRGLYFGKYPLPPPPTPPTCSTTKKRKNGEKKEKARNNKILFGSIFMSIFSKFCRRQCCRYITLF
jgi:hypothetical protein